MYIAGTLSAQTLLGRGGVAQASSLAHALRHAQAFLAPQRCTRLRLTWLEFPRSGGQASIKPGELQFGENRGAPRAFAHAVIDGGADLVLGSGPHVLRGMERYKDRLIAYSLGNSAGHTNFGMGGVLSNSGILHVKIGPSGRAISGKFTSVQLVGPGTPVIDAANVSARLVDRLSREDFDHDRFLMDNDGRFGQARRDAKR